MSDSTTDDPKIAIIGGRQFAASCITLGIMRRHADALKTVIGMKVSLNERLLPSAEEFQAVIDIVGAAVKPLDPLPPSPNPKMTAFEVFVDDLDFKLGVRDVLGALTKVMKLSGYQEPATVEDPGSGESGSAAPLT